MHFFKKCIRFSLSGKSRQSRNGLARGPLLLYLLMPQKTVLGGGWQRGRTVRRLHLQASERIFSLSRQEARMNLAEGFRCQVPKSSSQAVLVVQGHCCHLSEGLSEASGCRGVGRAVAFSEKPPEASPPCRPWSSPTWRNGGHRGAKRSSTLGAGILPPNIQEATWRPLWRPTEPTGASS